MTEIFTHYSDALPTAAAQRLGIPQNRSRFSTVLMGWNTYAIGLPAGMTSPYAHLEQIVFSRTHRADDDAVMTTSEHPVSVVRALKDRSDTGIWLCGGGALAATLIDEIDRLIIKRNPVLLGDGIPMFGTAPYEARTFHLTGSTSFTSGVTIEEYIRNR